MWSEFDECIRELAKAHKDAFLPNEELNKKLKLLSYYLIELVDKPAERSEISTTNPTYAKYSEEHFEKALDILGFVRAEDQRVFQGDLQAVTTNKPQLLEVLFNHRHFTLAEVSEYVQKKEKPPGIQQIDDTVTSAAPSTSQLSRPPKPWE